MYFKGSPNNYSYGGQFLAIKLALYGRTVQILEFVDDSRSSIVNFRDSENLFAEIMFGSLGIPHHLLADAHVLPHPKRRFFATKNASPDLLDSLPYGKHVRIGDSRWRHATRPVNRVILDLDKFRQNIDLSAGSFIRKIFVE